MLNTQLLKQNLSAGIRQLLDTPFNEQSDPNSIKQQFADGLADVIANAVDEWIREADVTVDEGIPVTTSGSPTYQTGTTTGPGSGTIS